MSLSPSDNAGSYSRASPAGKTPPPAPSAAYAKRAREIQAEERMGGRYLPPALRALAASSSPPNDQTTTPPIMDESTLPPTNHQPGFRRARAGTLPSNVQLAAQRFAAASNTVTGTSASNESLGDPVPRLPVIPNSNISPQVGPNVRHATSSASTAVSSAASDRNSRLRSGSLTLPAAGISNAFGSSIFSSSWLSSSNTTGNGYSVLEELRSVASADSGADDFDVHTLDYLGLDDHRPPPAATISELRNQAQAAIAGNLANPARMRASTVSNPYHARPISNSLLAAPTTEEEEEFFDNYDEPLYGRSNLTSSRQDSFSSNPYLNKSFKQIDPLSSRPRAISVGTLDDPIRSMQQRRAAIEPYIGEMSLQSGGHSVAANNSLSGTNGILKTLATSRTTVSSNSVHFQNTSGSDATGRGASYLIAPSSQNRSLSPKYECASQTQTPTRSLWIGNLDSAVTSEQLIHVFAPYGAIESLRLLPEKECGFVNFVDQADAIRAKEDVLNRLGGNIGMPNGQMVRIGFGKADSAPVAPAKGTPAVPPTVPPSGVAGKTSGPISGIGSMDAQLQSTPTRALWIGSIPSTTTPATILSVFSPYGPIESARVLTHKNCGFVNFERLDDAVRARKALNGRDVLGSDVGAIRIGFAKVPVKNGQDGNGGGDDNVNIVVQGVGDLSVGATIHALRSVKGASTLPADQQVLGGAVENYRSNLLLSMIGSGMHATSYPDGLGKPGWGPSVTEQQMIMKELSADANDAEADIQSLAEFRPPMMYYTTIPLVSDRPHNRRWDAAKLRELRKRLDSGTMSGDDVDSVAGDFLDAEIVDLASDWLGNTVVQKLFEKCSSGPRLMMLERIAPHLAMIGIHKNGTWAAQKIIECVSSQEEVTLVAQNLRPYAPPLLLDQFGNYVVQCCLRFGSPANDYIFDAIVDRMWEVAQGRFGARSMRACLESPHTTVSQQRRVATAIILNSIPLATNPNGALLLTWLLDASGFPSRYNLLAPRFTPHLSHLCTHKLASLTVLRIVNQKIEPQASRQVVDALFSSSGDHVLTDVLGDQVNGVAVVHKVLTSSFIEPALKTQYTEATKRVLIELKVIATQAYRRLIEEVGLPVPNFQPTYNNMPGTGKGKMQNTFGMPGLPSGYPSSDQGLASMMAAIQMGGQNPQAQQLSMDSVYNASLQRRSPNGATLTAFPSPSDPFNPFSLRTADSGGPGVRRAASGGQMPSSGTLTPTNTYGALPQPNIPQSTPILGMGQSYGGMIAPSVQSMPTPHVFQQYVYQGYPANPQNMRTFQA